MKKDKVIFILGPTAVGKTFVGVNLAKKFGGEVISADSVQIFCGLDIGSAKVTEQEMNGVTHHGIDICQPDEEFSVYDFVEYTRKKIKEIVARGNLPIVVGGTGLYIKALVLGYNFGGVDKDKNLRDELEKLADENGNEILYEKLEQLDESLAKKTDKNNRVRLVRALEIAMSQGEKKTSSVDIHPLIIALNKPRDVLYDSINKRVDEMIATGLVDEVKSLRATGLTRENQSMHAIGYKEVLAYLDGEISFEKCVELVKQHSRNYAKRQLTFLRGMNDVVFVDVEDKQKALERVENLVGDFLKNEKVE